VHAPTDGRDVTEVTQDQTALSSLSRRLMTAHEKERASVARKLHDDICQRMMTLTLRLHGLSEARADGTLQERVAELSDQLSALATEIFSLPDPVYSRIATLGLAAVAASYCHTLSSEQGVFVDFRQEDVPARVPNEVALALFRVLQEAVENAVSHAKVRDIWVSLRGTADEIHLEVADLGIGFDVAKVMQGHALGLMAMRERLGLVGGDLEIHSTRGQGTRIRARAPLGHKPQA
jgi:two-component system sensor histidine kinase NreB